MGLVSGAASVDHIQVMLAVQPVEVSARLWNEPQKQVSIGALGGGLAESARSIILFKGEV
jgi:hypothetical protein